MSTLPYLNLPSGLLGCPCDSLNKLSLIFPFQLDVVRQNFLSRTKREKIVCTKIDHVAFSDDGGWLATVSLNVQCLTLNIKYRVDIVNS